MRAVIAWLGLREAVLPYDRDARAAREIQYRLMKMLRFSWTAISSFSALPLRMTMAIGFVFSALGFVYLLCALVVALAFRPVFPGWTSLIAVQCVFCVNLVCLGLVERPRTAPLYAR